MAKIRTVLRNVDRILQNAADTEEETDGQSDKRLIRPGQSPTGQNLCLMPVLVTSPAVDTHKVIDRSSLRSYTLRQPLSPVWNLSGGRRSDAAPGRQHWQERRMRHVLNPDSPLNRILLKDTYDLQLPLVQEQRQPATPPGKPVTGPLVDHLPMPPRANRLDPQLALPPISAKDARRGLYSLMERRWIPPHALLTLAPSPVDKRPATLHRFTDKFTVPVIETTPTYAGIVESREKVGVLQILLGGPCVSPQTHYPRAGRVVPPPGRKRQLKTTIREVPRPSVIRTVQRNSLHSFQEPPVQVPRKEAESAVGATASCTFTLHRGHLYDTPPEFGAFKRRHLLDWRRIVTKMNQLKELLTENDVPVAIIQGERLAELTETCRQEERQPTQEELFSLMENREVVEAAVSHTGEECTGSNRAAEAALQIQTTWRRYRDRANYLQYQRLRVTVGVIEDFWTGIKVRRKAGQWLQQVRADQLQRFRERAKVFARSWKEIQTSRHVVIHVPSLGYRHSVRERMDLFRTRQNTQMARLCEINDPNVDVIYVSPVPLTREVLQYYRHLLGLSGAVESGQAEVQCDLSDRYRILMPEAVNGFPGSYSMCLSSLLKYSPCTLQRLSTLIRGRQAYLIPGHVHHDDLAVADALDVPVLGSEPEVVARYSGKSGAREIFQCAGVCVPPGVRDVSCLEKLYEHLTQLVIDNLLIQVWLLKLNDEVDGQGIAYCHVTAYLTCFPWLQSEAEHFGNSWMQGWPQEAAFSKVLAEVPCILENHCMVPQSYKSWDFFLQEFLSQGGVIEAYPPTGDVTSQTVNLLLEPDGGVKLLMAGDQINANSPLKVWGLSVPQTSVEPMLVNKVCKRVARACRDHGVVGYVAMDLVTFVDPMMLEQVVWALDLHLGYSDSLALFQLAGYLTQAQFHPRFHTYRITAREGRKAQCSTKEEAEDTLRFCVMSSQLLHSNLALLRYSVLFRLCRGHGIGFDIKDREGTLFALIDNYHREHLGMITIGKSLQSTMATFIRHLYTLREQVTAPDVQGVSNFAGAIEEMENILGIIQHNLDHQRMSSEQVGEHKPARQTAAAEHESHAPATHTR